MARIILWMLYSVAVLFLLSRNVFDAVLAESVSALMILGAINISLNLIAVFGYVYAKPILNRSFWAGLFWVNAALRIFQVAVFSVLLLQMPLSWLFAMIDMVIFLPLLWVLYRYGSIENPIWGAASQSFYESQLEQMMAEKGRLESTTVSQLPDGPLTTYTTIEKQGDGYRVRIEKTSVDGSEITNNDLPDLSSVANFLRYNTHSRVGDFG